MKKDNIFSKTNSGKPNSSYFTGSVIMKEVSKTVKSKEQKIYHVTFKNGARTKIHQHSGGQVLIVTKGKGSLVMYNKTSTGKSNFGIKKSSQTNINVGDIVYIPAKKLHTHGSVNKKQTFSHIAMNAYPAKNKEPVTIWYESDFKNSVTKIL